MQLNSSKKYLRLLHLVYSIFIIGFIISHFLPFTVYYQGAIFGANGNISEPIMTSEKLLDDIFSISSMGEAVLLLLPLLITLAMLFLIWRGQAMVIRLAKSSKVFRISLVWNIFLLITFGLCSFIYMVLFSFDLLLSPNVERAIGVGQVVWWVAYVGGIVTHLIFVISVKIIGWKSREEKAKELDDHLIIEE